MTKVSAEQENALKRDNVNLFRQVQHRASALMELE